MAEVITDFYPKANPNAFFDMANQAVGFANAAQQNKLLQTQNQQTQLDLVKDQVAQLVNGFSTLASLPDINPSHFAEFGQRMVDEGLITPDIYQLEMKQVMAAQGDPQKLRQLAGNYSLRALDAGQKFSAQYGAPEMINTGNQFLPVAVSPLTGVSPLGAPIQQTLSPSQLAAPAQIGITPQGQPITGTTGQFLEKTGVNPLTAMPSQAPNALMPQGSAPQQQGVVTTLPMGQSEAMQAVGQEAGKELADARTREAKFQADILPLQKAIPALEALGTTGTGPGTEQINEIKSFLASMGVPGVDLDKIQKFDEARKYLTQYAQTVGDTGTNDKLAASFAGNPSVGISNAAAVDVAKTALTLRKYQNAQLRAFEQMGLPESQFTQFATQFAANQDPRAYGIDMMSPEARKALIEGLDGAEKSKFVQSLKTAIGLGLVKQPG